MEADEGVDEDERTQSEAEVPNRLNGKSRGTNALGVQRDTNRLDGYI